MQGLLTVADWATKDDKAIIDEPVHECRVLIPSLLAPDLARGIPVWTVDQPHREIGHARSVLTATDTGPASDQSSTSPIGTSGHAALVALRL